MLLLIVIERLRLFYIYGSCLVGLRNAGRWSPWEVVSYTEKILFFTLFFSQESSSPFYFELGFHLAALSQIN